MIIRNGKTTSALYKGTKEIVKRYKGTLLVYEAFKGLIVNGVPPLTLLNCKGVDLVDYKIFGNSVQDGTPTPNTPIEVESVGERTKNLWEFDIKEITVDTKEEVYKFSEPITKSCTFYYRETDYTSTGNIWLIGFRFKDGNYVYLYPNHIKQHTIRNINATEDNPLTQVQVRNGGSSYITTGSIDNFMLVEGTYDSDTMPDYEPYGYKIPVKASGKNLVEKLYDGYADIDVFPELGSVGSLVFQTIKLKNVKAGTYTFSFERPVNIVRSMSTSSHNAYLSIRPNLNLNTQITTIKLEQNEEEYQLSFRDSVSNNTQWNNGWVQCEIGDTPTEYEPYIEPITTNIYLNEPLRKVEDSADYVDFKQGKVVRNIGQIIYNGSENWGDYQSRGYLTSNTKVICNLLVNSQINTTSLAIRKAYNYLYAYGTHIDYPTVDDWKNFLSSTNMQVIGKLNTPDDTETIELPNIPTIKGTTILSVDTTIQPSNLEVVYKGK